MAISRFKVALNAARFPLVSTKGSRAVFVPGVDSAPRTPRQFVGTDESVDYNMAQILYMENVMPVSEGLHSAGYVNRIPSSASTGFDSVFPLRDADENVVLYSPAKGQNYIWGPTSTAWVADPLEAGIWGLPVDGDSERTPETAVVTYAYVDGKTLVCYSRLKGSSGALDMSLLRWEPFTQTLIPAATIIANPPFPIGEIDGISSSNGFLLIWSGLSVAWARFNGTAFDFEPYANGAYTGSGAQIPEDIQGPITAIIGTAGGFLMFTARNCIAASYNAQNLVAPWAFREVPGAGGVASYEQVTIEGSLSTVYAYTTSGFQRISLNSAESEFGAIADFIAGRQLERFNTITNTLSSQISGQDLAVKISNIGNRFITVSYGLTVGNYEYILVWDLVLQRWGKLRVNHVDCFNYSYVPVASQLTYAQAAAIRYSDMSTTPYSAGGQDPTNSLIAAQHSLAIITSTGQVQLAQWSDTLSGSRGDQGVAIIGRIQLSRSRFTQLNRVEAEGFTSGSLWVIPSYDGATNAAPEELTDVSFGTGVKVFGGLIDCKNFLLLAKGAFDLSTLILEAQPTGQI